MSDFYSPENLAKIYEGAQKMRERLQAIPDPYQQQRDYYGALRQQYSDDMPGLRDEDYAFLDLIHPFVEASKDPTRERDRILSAAAFSNALNIPLGDAYVSLDTLTEQWTGASWVPANGLKAVVDSFEVGVLGQKHNVLAIQYHNSGQDPEILKQLEKVERQIEEKRDRLPKVWQDEYVWRGGMEDVGAIVRSLLTTTAENAPFIALTAGASALTATGVGAIATAAGLSAGLSGLLVTGATMTATAAASYGSTVGTEYRDLLTQGIPEDIAWTTANVSSLIQGAIEAAGGGVVSSVAKGFIKAAAPGVIGKSVTSFFIKGKMGLLGKAVVEYTKQGFGEFGEEGAQSITSDLAYNYAAGKTQERREEIVRRLYGELTDDIRQQLEKELENYPELTKKEFDEIMDNAMEAAWGGFAAAVILGAGGAVSNYRGDVQTAKKLADMARKSPNDVALVQELRESAEAGGPAIPEFNEMPPEEQQQFATDLFQNQQERMTPEERETKERNNRAATAMAEVTDYSNVSAEKALNEETGEERETGEFTPTVAAEIYRERGKLVTDIDEVEQDDGTVRGEFALGDPRIADEGNRESQYGHIDYTVEGDRVRIDRFQMMEGYESLRGEFYQEFAEYFAGKDISWDPANKENLPLREQLVQANPRGPNAGLNYVETAADVPVSRDTRAAAALIRPYLPKATPLETALVVEAFNFLRQPGEDINQAFNRLGIEFTNKPGQAMAAAAQRRGNRVKGATWAQETAEGMKRVIYLNRNAADASTLAHELFHVTGKALGDQDLKALAKALNGYRLRDGSTVAFDENTITPESFTADTAQQEAFAEAGEQYLATGKAPTAELTRVFDRIKDFLKRIYRAMKGWTRLSPQAESFFQSLFSGERQETGGPDYAGMLDRRIDELNEDSRRRAREMAGEGEGQALFQEQDRGEEKALSPEDRRHAPTAALLMDAMRIPDDAERARVTRNIRDLRDRYAGTEAEYRAPNGEPSLLLGSLGEERGRRAWYAVRTDNFKAWFGEWESAAEIAAMEARIAEWTSKDSLDKAKGKSREEIFQEYDNTLQPIAYVPEQYLASFDSTPSDNRVYCGQAYFLDHAVNHHPEITPSDYGKLQEILSNPDEVIVDRRINTLTGKPRNNLLFTKKYDTNLIAAISLEEDTDGKILLHKSLYGHKKTPYPSLPRVQGISSGVGPAPISTAANATSAGNLSAPDDISSIAQNPEEVKGNVPQHEKSRDSDRSLPGKHLGGTAQPASDTNLAEFLNSVNPSEVSQVRDANGEPLVVYHGSKKNGFSVFNTGEHTGYAGRKQSGAFFSADKEYANSYGENSTTAFLNIKNPLMTTEYSDISMLNDDRINSLGGNYDGVVFNDIADGTPYAPKEDALFLEIAVFSPEQIKSATDNAGTYSQDNSSILFQEEFPTQQTAPEDARAQADRVIADPTVPLEDKAGIILDQAGEALRAASPNPVPENKPITDPGLDVLFQKTEAQIIEEGATFPSWQEWKAFDEAVGEPPLAVVFLTEEQKDAWYKAAWEKGQLAKIVVQPSLDEDGLAEPAGDAAQTDQEFKTLLNTPDMFDEFLERAASYEDIRFDEGALDEESQMAMERDKAIADQVRATLSHPTWRAAIKKTLAGGTIQDRMRKELITRMKAAPRDYRALYAAVMDAPQWAVSEEDSTAATLRYRLANASRGIDEDLDRLSPERRREIAAQLDIEDVSRRLANGTLTLGELDREVKAYIRELDGQIKTAEEKLEAQKEREREDNEYLQAHLNRQLLREHDRMLEARGRMAAARNELTRALDSGIQDIDQYTAAARQTVVNYNTILRRLESLEGWTELSRKAEVSTAQQEGRVRARLERHDTAVIAALRRKEDRAELRDHIRELQRKKKSQKIDRDIKRNFVKRIMRRINMAEIAAEQARPMAVIQALVEPSLLRGVDQFIGPMDRPHLREIMAAWKTDDVFREGLIKEVGKERGAEIGRILSRVDSYEKLTGGNIRALYKNLPRKDWARALGLDEIISKRNLEIYTNDIKEIRRDGNLFAEPGEQSAAIAQKYLPAHLYYLVQNVSFAEWTVAQAEELAKIMDQLTVEGKQRRTAALMLEKQRMAEYRQKALAELRKAGEELKESDTPEERAAKLKKAEAILGKYDFGPGGTLQSEKARRRNLLIPSFFGIKSFQFFRMISGGDEHGVNVSLTYRRASDAYNQKHRNIDRRVEAVMKILEDAGIALNELYKPAVSEDLGGKMGVLELTVGEALGFLSAIRDDYSKAAVFTGSLLHETEREPYQVEGMTEAGRAGMYALAADRYTKVLAAANAFFEREENKKFKRIMDAIDRDFKEGGDRVNMANVAYSNSFVDILEYYFPIDRVSPIGEGGAAQKIRREILGASSGPVNLFADKGFTKSRKQIPPEYQTAIKLDIMRVFTEAVEREEHFMAYGQLVKDLHRIYGVKEGRQVRTAIQRRYGDGALRYIDGYINELAVPNAQEARTGFGDFIRTTRGRTAPAYLAWKLSAILKQGLTSPWPFLPYVNPLEYWGSMLRWAAHPVQSWETISDLSPRMKHRSFSILSAITDEAVKNSRGKALHGLDVFNNAGMEGLKWVDRWAVAPGWMALYEKEHRRLSAEGKLTETDMQTLAAQYADDITRQVQPFAEKDDLPPMHKMGGDAGEIGMLLLQFTQSLNTIYNNIRYDMPQQRRAKLWGNLIGGIVGYMGAGLLLGFVTEGFDDDDSDEEKARKLLHWSTTQFTDSVPLLGSWLTSQTEGLITGKRRYRNSFNLFPLLDSGGRTIEKFDKAIRKEDMEKARDAMMQALETGMMAGGLPVSGLDEFTRIFGIPNGKPHPEAALGRRKKP